jgi:chaperone required for assembly of F1-ATPase
VANGRLRILHLNTFSYSSLTQESSLAMERATYTTKSYIIALALVHGRITAEQAALASQVEVASQIERWGEVEDCAYVHRFVNLRGLTLYIQPTTLTTMTCDGTSVAQLVY